MADYELFFPAFHYNSNPVSTQKFSENIRKTCFIKVLRGLSLDFVKSNMNANLVGAINKLNTLIFFVRSASTLR